MAILLLVIKYNTYRKHLTINSRKKKAARGPRGKWVKCECRSQSLRRPVNRIRSCHQFIWDSARYPRGPCARPNKNYFFPRVDRYLTAICKINTSVQNKKADTRNNKNLIASRRALCGGQQKKKKNTGGQINIVCSFWCQESRHLFNNTIFHLSFRRIGTTRGQKRQTSRLLVGCHSVNAAGERERERRTEYSLDFYQIDLVRRTLSKQKNAKMCRWERAATNGGDCDGRRKKKI